MAEPLLDLLEELRAANGRVTPEQAVDRIRDLLDTGAPPELRFILHRWFAVRRSVAANASERRFLDEVEAALLWSPDIGTGCGAGAPDGVYRPTA